jgi:DNA-binding XRE family transcriptional regulator
MANITAPQTMGSKIAQARKKRGLTQGELAQLAGCSRQTVCNIEHDHQDLTGKILRRLARTLKVSIVALWPDEA